MPNLRVALELSAEDLASPQIRRVITQVERLQQATQRLGQQQAGAGASGMVRLSRDTAQAQQTMSGFQQVLQQAFGIAGGIGIADVIAAIASGLVSVSSQAISANASLQRMQVTLRAFTRDRALADAMTAMLRANADVTPFGTAEVMQAGTQLVPIARTTEDLERAVRLAERLATLNAEQGLQGATFALREAAAGDFLSLQERFNIPRNLVNQLRGQGFQGLDLAEEALRRMGVTWDLVEEQGKTFEGRLSTMTSALQELLRVAGQPAFETLSRHLDVANTALQQNRPGIGSVAVGAGAVAGEVLDEQLTTWERAVRDFNTLGDLLLNPFRMGAAQATRAAPGVGGFLSSALAALGEDEDLAALGAPIAALGPRLRSVALFLRQADEALFGVNRAALEEQRRGERSPADAATIERALETERVRVNQAALLRQRAGERNPVLVADIERAREAVRAASEQERRTFEQADDAITRHTGLWRGVANAITDAGQKVAMYNQRLGEFGPRQDVVARLLDPLYAARGLARRTGGDRGQFDAAILDLLTRRSALVRQEGVAALEAYLARRYDETLGGDFYESMRVTSMQVDQLVVNGTGGYSQVGGTGQVTPVSDMISRRYENSRSSWPWAPGVAGALR